MNVRARSPCSHRHHSAFTASGGRTIPTEPRDVGRFCYTAQQRTVGYGGGADMRRFVLFAVLQWFGILAFCQSAAVTPGTAQASPDVPLPPQSLFSFNGAQFGQVGQNFLSTKQGNMPTCEEQVQSQNKARSQVDFNQLFNMSCMDMRPKDVAIARIELPLSPLSTRKWPDAHFGPIPTQWPDAKVEQIPGAWPNLKMLPIAEQKTDSIPEK